MAGADHLAGLMSSVARWFRHDTASDVGIVRLRPFLMTDCDRLMMARKALAANDHGPIVRERDLATD
jgi:hypothetical protein